MGVYFLSFFPRMLLSKDMVLKGAFFPANNFQIFVFFLGQKIAFKNIYHTLEDFSKFDRPFKSTVWCNLSVKIFWVMARPEILGGGRYIYREVIYQI